MTHNLFNSLQQFSLASGKIGKFYSLAALESAGLGALLALDQSADLRTFGADFAL